jgi:hypothetical protein
MFGLWNYLMFHEVVYDMFMWNQLFLMYILIITLW